MYARFIYVLRGPLFKWCIVGPLKMLSRVCLSSWYTCSRWNRVAEGYFETYFAGHLDAVDIQASDTADHPILTFINCLHQIVYYRPSSHNGDWAFYLCQWLFISAILSWVSRQQKASVMHYTLWGWDLHTFNLYIDTRRLWIWDTLSGSWKAYCETGQDRG